jgi:inosose dehydratase
MKIANAPVSWGVIENVAGDRGAYRRVLDEIAETGYTGTELGDWGFLPTDPAALRAELDARGLALIGSWVSVQLHDAGQQETSAAAAVRTARLLAEVGGPGCVIVLGNDPYGDPTRTLYAGRITPELAMDEPTLATLARGAEGVARRVREETGLRTVFHHHIGTLVETPDEMALLLARTDPALLGVCFDTGHWTFGGGDAVAGVQAFGERIWHVHFKDVSPTVAAQSRAYGWDGVTAVGKGVFCELGQGMVDFPAVRDALRALQYDGWIVVEQDILPGMGGTPKASAARNRAYLRDIGL